jgi:hypothetical protein
LSNRWLYTFIILGIFAVVGVGVYAAYPASGAGHNADEIDFSGVGNIISSGYIHGSTTGGNANLGSSAYEISGTNIAGQTVYSYGSMCVGNSVHDCSGTGGTVITSSDVSTGTVYTGNWFRSYGQSGWYSQTYGGGWYMIDTTWIRAYNGKSIYTPSEIQAGGNMYAASFIYSSDESLKTNITLLNNALEKVKQLEGVSFNWKNTGRADIGLIAQDVEKVIPEIVHTNEEGLKSVEYGNLVAILIEAVKEQQEEIDSQDYKIDSLQKQIDELRN